MIPLTAVTIALAEFLFDHTQPRWTGPWFWLALVATVGLLILVQVLRFGASKAPPPAKPDYSATSIVRRRSGAQASEASPTAPAERGTR